MTTSDYHGITYKSPQMAIYLQRIWPWGGCGLLKYHDIWPFVWKTSKKLLILYSLAIRKDIERYWKYRSVIQVRRFTSTFQGFSPIFFRPPWFTRSKATYRHCSCISKATQGAFCPSGIGWWNPTGETFYLYLRERIFVPLKLKACSK